MTEKTFTGPIQRQLRDALQYLRNYTLKEVVLKESTRAEAKRICNYPYAAVEEILANAVYHRSYQVNEPITVRITSRAIEITSFPGFDRSITDDQIARQDIRARMYRNRRIGDFLKELRLIGGRNTGFPNAKKALAENGSGPLAFEMNPDRDYLSVIIPVHSYFLPSRKNNSKQEAYRLQIAELLGAQPMTLTELAKAMGYKGITKKLSGTVAEMCRENQLRRVTVGNDIKYAAAHAGRDV